MKKILLATAALSLLYLSAVGQTYTYVPIPMQNALWEFSHSLNGRYYFQWMIDGSDTTIDGIIYKKITRRFGDKTNQGPLVHPRKSEISPYPDEFVAAIREENKMVYMRRYDDHGWQGEKLVFDFNAALGGMLIPYFEVIDIDTIEVAGTLRKKYEVKSTLVYNQFTVIEGAANINTAIDISTHGYENWYCFSVNSVSEKNLPHDCSYIWPYGTPTSVASVQQEVTVQVYPNPFDNTLNIAAEKGTASLYNSIGALVAQQRLTGKQTAMNTAQLAVGMYFLVVKDEKGQLLHRQQVVK